MTYKIRYRRRRSFFWRTKTIIGHRIDPSMNRLDLFLPDGSLYSLGKADEYTILLGTDWVIVTEKLKKQAQQQQANQAQPGAGVIVEPGAKGGRRR